MKPTNEAPAPPETAAPEPPPAPNADAKPETPETPNAPKARPETPEADAPEALKAEIERLRAEQAAQKEAAKLRERQAVAAKLEAAALRAFPGRDPQPLVRAVEPLLQAQFDFALDAEGGLSFSDKAKEASEPLAPEAALRQALESAGLAPKSRADAPAPDWHGRDYEAPRDAWPMQGMAAARQNYREQQAQPVRRAEPRQLELPFGAA